jgi:hypothetical protein
MRRTWQRHAQAVDHEGLGCLPCSHEQGSSVCQHVSIVVCPCTPVEGTRSAAKELSAILTSTIAAITARTAANLAGATFRCSPAPGSRILVSMPAPLPPQMLLLAPTATHMFRGNMSGARSAASRERTAETRGVSVCDALGNDTRKLLTTKALACLPCSHEHGSSVCQHVSDI